MFVRHLLVLYWLKLLATRNFNVVTGVEASMARLNACLACKNNVLAKKAKKKERMERADCCLASMQMSTVGFALSVDWAQNQQLELDAAMYSILTVSRRYFKRNGSPQG